MPLPQFSEDDVLNYFVVEALMIRDNQEQAEAQKKRELEEWKRKPLGSG